MSYKNWFVHIDQILEGKRKSALELSLQSKLSTRRRGRGLGLSNSDKKNEIASVVDKLISELKADKNNNKKNGTMLDFDQSQEIDRMITTLKSYTGDIKEYQAVINNTHDSKEASTVLTGVNSMRELEIVNLGLILIEAAKWNHEELAELYIKEGFPINFQHPRRNCTALHDAVRTSNSNFAKALMSSGKPDYLIKDNQGQTAYDVAYVHCYDIDLTDTLRIETEKQAIARGVDINGLFSIELN